MGGQLFDYVVVVISLLCCRPYNRLLTIEIEDTMAKDTKKETVKKIGDRFYVLRSVCQSKTDEPLGLVPIWIPDPSANADAQMEQFCPILEADFKGVLACYIQGKAVALQGKARRIAAGGSTEPTDAEIGNVVDSLPTETITALLKQGYMAVRDHAKRIILAERLKTGGTKYSKDYVWESFC